MFALCLKILFSPTEATIEEARNHIPNYWQNSFLAMFVAIFFTALLKALPNLFLLLSIKGITVTGVISSQNSLTLIIMTIVGKRFIALFFVEIFILICLVMFSYLFGRIGSVGQFFFIRVLYNLPIFIVLDVLIVMTIVSMVFHIKLISLFIMGRISWFLLFFLIFYSYYFDYLTLKVVYNLNRGRAVMVLISSVILLALGYGCFWLAFYIYFLIDMFHDNPFR